MSMAAVTALQVLLNDDSLSVRAAAQAGLQRMEERRLQNLASADVGLGPKHEEREAAAKAERDRLERETAAKIERDRLEREATARVERDRLERNAAAEVERDRLERNAAAKVERDRLERNAAAKVERDRLERNAAAEVERDRLEREVTVEAERDRLQRESTAKAERDKLAGEATAKAERVQTWKQRADEYARAQAERKRKRSPYVLVGWGCFCLLGGFGGLVSVSEKGPTDNTDILLMLFLFGLAAVLFVAAYTRAKKRIR
jgi:hypothetical protein